MGYATPEEAALATWTCCPTANARVVAVEIRGREAQVVIDTDPSYEDYVGCVLTDDGWVEVASGNGPCFLWSRHL